MNLQQLSPKQLLKASVVVAVITIALKTLAWYVTGSVALLSDAMESLVNLASAAFALWMVSIAERPADEDHPFGHYKAEYFSSGFEGFLILAAAVAIIVAASYRLFSPQPLEQVGLGLALSLVSTAINGALAWLMLRVGRAKRSIALEADARHLMTDVWTTLGVVVGIVAVWATGWLWLDAAVAIAVALNIVREGVHLMWRSSQGLMDEAMDAQDLQAIHAVLQSFATQKPNDKGGADILRFDHLHTRKAGQRCFVDVHMHMPASWTLGRAAALRGNVEQALMDAVPGLRAAIQLLPNDVESREEINRAQDALQ
jgi:cation diffusion facilitator family transporter